MPSRLLYRNLPPVITRDYGEVIEWPVIQNVLTEQIQGSWLPGAPIVCNVVKDEDYHPHATHLRLVAALLPHKEG